MLLSVNMYSGGVNNIRSKMSVANRFSICINTCCVENNFQSFYSYRFELIKIQRGSTFFSCPWTMVKKYRVITIFSVNITALDEHEMAQALVGYQPVSIAFEVVSDFMHYKDGVYSSTDCKVLAPVFSPPRIPNLLFRMVQMMSTTLS